MVEITDYVKTQTELLQAEREYERKEILSCMNGTKLSNLEASGLAITRLHIQSISTDVGGRQVILLHTHAKRPISCPRISTGDIVTLRLQSRRQTECTETQQQQTEGIVVKLKETTIEIVCDTQLIDDDNTTEYTTSNSYIYSVIKSTNNITYKRYIKALSQLTSICKDTTHPTYRLLNILLTNNVTPKWSPFIPTYDKKHNAYSYENKYESLKSFPNNLPAYLNHLNEGQLEAIDQCLKANDLSTIIGPPGTGKTTTITSYIAYESSELNHRILVVAPSNTAVDNIGIKLQSLNINFIRCGHSARMNKQLQRYSLENKILESDDIEIINDIKNDIKDTKKREIRKELRKELKQKEFNNKQRILNNYNVILSTLNGSGSYIFDEFNQVFDIVIIDEAAQALESNIWPAVVRCKKLILTGDPFQLGGIIKDTSLLHKDETLQNSILDRIIKSTHLTYFMLSVQYRMNKLICDWSSNEFYEGKLIPDESIENLDLTSLPNWTFDATKEGDDDQGVYFPFIVIDTAGGDCEEEDLIQDDFKNSFNSSKRNHGEVGIMRHVVKDFLNHGVDLEDIGIISPYSGQIELLKSELHRVYDKSRLEISTIDSFQGREKEIICISMVRSNEIGQIGFLKDKRRLNVAITRAKKCVVIICDSETVCQNEFINRIVKYSEDHGVYRSAVVEFQEIVGTFSQLRRPKEAIDALQTTGSKNTQKVIGDKNGSGGSSSSSSSSNKNIKDKKDGVQKSKVVNNETESETETEIERIERLRQELRTEVKRFIENDLIVEKWFSNNLSALQRRLVHEIAEEEDVCHASHGEGSDRQVKIWKRRKDLGEGNGDFVEDNVLTVAGIEATLIADVDQIGLDDIDSDGGEITVEGKEENEEYVKQNKLLSELRKARDNDHMNVNEDTLGNNSVRNDSNKNRKNRNRNKKNKRTVTKRDDGDSKMEDDDFENTLKKYGWNNSNGSGNGHGHGQGSNVANRFPPSVGQIVNGVLVEAVGSSSQHVSMNEKARRDANKKKLADKLSKQKDQRRRHAKS